MFVYFSFTFCELPREMSGRDILIILFSRSKIMDLIVQSSKIGDFDAQKSIVNYLNPGQVILLETLFENV